MRNANPVEIFVVAEQFRSARRRLTVDSDDAPHGDAPLPAITCSAFATELYLKCLAACDHGRPLIGHDLRHLFNHLNRQTQAQIRKHFEPFLQDVKDHIHREWHLAGKMPDANVDFDYVLDASRKGFVLARYLHETGLPNEQGWIADGIMEAARSTILLANPDWAQARMTSPIVKRSNREYPRY